MWNATRGSAANIGLAADFFTNFPANENPISQGGIWLNGATDGVDWTDVETTNATDSIHRACGPSFVSGYNDPTAILKPSYRQFHPDQFAEGVIYRQSGYTPSNQYDEAELHVRFSLSAHSAVGYEVLFALNDPAVKPDGYAVVKWLGSLGSFTTIYNGDGHIVPVISDGDIFRVELRGQTMRIFRNGTQLDSDLDVTQSGTISLVSSGNPGIGFFPQTPGDTVAAYGWRSFKCGDLS